MKDAAAAAAAAAAGAGSPPQGGANDCKKDGCVNACISGPGAPSSAAVATAPAPAATGVASLTPEEQQAVRKARRDRARETKLMQNITRVKSAQLQQKKHGGGGGSKHRRGAGRRGKGKGKSEGGGSMTDNVPDLFDEWLGAKLTAWSKGTAHAAGGRALAQPPEASGVTEEIDFDPSKDEIAFPISLSAQQRRQVHGWAMQLALYHASSGEDKQRHVIVSKTGVFQGKLLTRGGRTWYKEGVVAPVVKRFALQPGHEATAEPIVAALRSFHESVQLREPGFEKWLKANAPITDPPDAVGSHVERAQEAFLSWPLLHEVECEYVDTQEKLRIGSRPQFRHLSALAEVLDSCKEFGFDLEAHNARTYHGLSCLLQVSTESQDYIIDPLAEGMWDSMSLLRAPFANPDVLKIGHSIRSLDVPFLYRDFGIVIINAIDTEESVHTLGEKHTGLWKVLINAGVRETHDLAELKQAMQACDWRERPLSPEKLVYARCDSHYLIPLWRLLRARLLAADTFSSREDQREEELREIKRGLDADQKRKEEAAAAAAASAAEARQRHPLPGALAPPAVGGNLPEKLPRRSGATSPSSLAQEPRVSEWDDPEDCHRRERSRSGSYFRPDLESIHESANGVGPAGTTAGGQSLERALAAAFQEDDDDDNDGGDDGGGGVHHHMVDLGENLMSEGEMEEEHQDDEQDVEEPGDEEDEDEDLWEGWGEDALGGDGGGGDGGTVADEGKQSLNGEEEASASATAVPLPLPDSTSTTNESNGSRNDGDGTGTVEGNQPSTEDGETRASSVVPLPSSPSAAPVTAPPRSPDSNGAASKGEHTRGRGGGSRPNGSGNGRARTTAREQPEVVVMTDGVRLMWKALSRTQTATAVLWRPGPEAERKDSHNERHFRTAVQRLKPPRWSEINIRVYEEIYLWRDRTARRMDDGAAYVCPGDILIDVALAMPKTLDALRRVSSPLSPVLGDADTPEAAELVRVVRVALGLPAEEEEEEGQGGGAAAGRIRGGVASRVRAIVGGGGYGGGAQGGVVFPTISLAIAAAAVSLGIVIALSKRRWFSIQAILVRQAETYHPKPERQPNVDRTPEATATASLGPWFTGNLKALPEPSTKSICLLTRLLKLRQQADSSNWRTAFAIGLLLFAAAVAQVVLASGIRQKGIHLTISFHGEGYNHTAGHPSIGLLAIGLAACFVTLSVLGKKKSRGGWVKVVKRMATVYSSITLVVLVVWSFVERAVYLELSSYEHCVTDVGTDNGEGDECVCSSGQSESNDYAEVDIASDDGISCESLPDHTDDVLALYVLVVIILVLTVVGIVCKPHTSKPKTRSIVLEANPTPYVVTHTSPTTQQWGRGDRAHTLRIDTTS
eukprot:g13281.t1